MKLKQILQDLPAGQALLHINVSTYDMMYAVLCAQKKISAELKTLIPIIIGASEKERDFMGEREIADYIHWYRKMYDAPVFSSADHTYSITRIKKAIDCKYDLVVCDFSKDKHDVNITSMKIVRRYRNVMQFFKTNKTLLEAEYGYVGDGSQIKEKAPENIILTTSREAIEYVTATGADLFAPSVGTVHGIVTGGNPRIETDLVKEIADAVKIPLVLHGGSGSTREDLRKSIQQGVKILHISTEIRKAYKDLLKEAMLDEKSLAPYDYLKVSKEKLIDEIVSRMKMCLGE